MHRQRFSTLLDTVAIGRRRTDAEMNKSKLRRERRKGAQLQPQELPANQERKMKGWVLRLIMIVPPALFACYLIWDLGRQ